MARRSISSTRGRRAWVRIRCRTVPWRDYFELASRRARATTPVATAGKVCGRAQAIDSGHASLSRIARVLVRVRVRPAGDPGQAQNHAREPWYEGQRRRGARHRP